MSSRIARRPSASSFPPDHVGLGRVAPVARRTDDDVGDHGVSLLEGAGAGHVDRAAHLGRVRAREEVADELDRPARGDLRRRLSGGEELDLAHAGHRGARDRLLAEPAELVPGEDLLELVPVLDQPDPVKGDARVDEVPVTCPARRASAPVSSRRDADATPAATAGTAATAATRSATGSRSIPNPRSP